MSCHGHQDGGNANGQGHTSDEYADLVKQNADLLERSAQLSAELAAEKQYWKAWRDAFYEALKALTELSESLKSWRLCGGRFLRVQADLSKSGGCRSSFYRYD